MKPETRESILEEEIIILRHSGEIPEIALHSSLYYLEEDEEGPQLTLRQDELHQLYDAALERAREIVLRDLDPKNRDLGIYRGVARSITNWRRLRDFCRRIDREPGRFNETVANALVSFLRNEIREVSAALRVSSVNCSTVDLVAFVRELSMDIDVLPDGWMSLCGDMTTREN